MKSTSVNLLRPPQIQELKRERDELHEKINGPWKHYVQKPGRVRQRLGELDKQLASGMPEPVTNPLERDTLAKREKALREKVTQGMLSSEEMRKNPPGAVDHHLRWERANKQDILEWKNIRLQLHADSSDPETWNRDEANLERYRPQGAVGRVRLDAQIPGVMAMSEQAKENWPLGEPTIDTALKQAERVAASERVKKHRERKRQERLAAKAQAEATVEQAEPMIGTATE